MPMLSLEISALCVDVVSEAVSGPGELLATCTSAVPPLPYRIVDAMSKKETYVGTMVVAATGVPA